MEDPGVLSRLFSRGKEKLPTLPPVQALPGQGQHHDHRRRALGNSALVQDTLPALAGGPPSELRHSPDPARDMWGRSWNNVLASANRMNHRITTHPMMERRTHEDNVRTLAHEFGHLADFRKEFPESIQILRDQHKRLRDAGVDLGYENLRDEYVASSFGDAVGVIREINDRIGIADRHGPEHLRRRWENVQTRGGEPIHGDVTPEVIMESFLSRQPPGTEVMLRELLNHEMYKDTPAAETFRRLLQQRPAETPSRGPQAR